MHIVIRLEKTKAKLFRKSYFFANLRGKKTSLYLHYFIVH